jgi:multicomponent Na+:H+ antiporter subunit B
MPRSLILRTVSLGLVFVIVMFSFYVFLKGHNQPGGGFIAGLIAAAMILIQHLAYSHEELDRTFYPVFHRMIGLGLLLAAGSGFFGIIKGTAFLDGFHWEFAMPWGGHFAIPSVIVFDLGVYLVVIGTVVGIFRALEEKRT